jgi:hypothetical protein
MNRYSVVYLLRKQYYHLCCRTKSEAISVLEHLFTLDGHVPVGIYDAKTELFYWEPQRQFEYNKAQIEEQGKLADQIIRISQALRRQTQTGQEQMDTMLQLLI